MEINLDVDNIYPTGSKYDIEPITGEYFRNNYLKPVYDYCLERNEDLTITLNGGYAFGFSFLEEAFGGMVRSGYDGR